MLSQRVHTLVLFTMVAWQSLVGGFHFQKPLQELTEAEERQREMEEQELNTIEKVSIKTKKYLN